MRRLARILVFIMTFTLDVRVRAATLSLPETNDPITVPTACIDSSRCVVKTRSGEKYTLHVGLQEVVLAPNSIFVRKSGTTGSLVDGYALVRSESNLDIETPYGTIQSSHAEFLIEKNQYHFWIRVLNGKVMLRLRGHEQDLWLAAGAQNWISRVNTSGLAEVGFPQPLDLNIVLKQVSPLWGGGVHKLREKMLALEEIWKDTVEQSSYLYAETVQREIADESKRQRQDFIKNEESRRERQYWRDMLWHKTFE